MIPQAPARMVSYAVLGALLLGVACEKGPPTGRPPTNVETPCPIDLLGAAGGTCAPDETTCTGSNGAAFTHLLMCSGGVWAEMEAAPPPPVAPRAPQAVDLSAYDQTCRSNADCELVRAAPCGRCGCTRDPIAVRERERFTAARDAIACAPIDPSTPEGTLNCGGCPGYEAWCEHGSCAARTR